MKSHYRNKSKYCTTSSSSGHVEPVRGYVDVVDSSDERFVDRNEWIKASPKVKGGKSYPMDLDDLPGGDEENEHMRAGDFKCMSQLPSGMGGHFKFSSEKQWEQAETEDFLDNTEASEYFTLNLKLLNVGLQTIPFYKRMDYSSAMFSKEQLQTMENEAEEAEKLYQNVLKEHIENPKAHKTNSANRKSSSAKSQKSVKAKSPEAPDELDELLNITNDQMSKVSLKSGANTPVVKPATPVAAAAPVSGGETKDDIQQWLDNVLDE